MKNRNLIITLVFFCASFAIAEDSKMLDGFSPEATTIQLQFEKRLKENISPEQIEKHFKVAHKFSAPCRY